eukprot:3681453-Alexandrium_andersonii.AAC.1
MRRALLYKQVAQSMFLLPLIAVWSAGPSELRTYDTLIDVVRRWVEDQRQLRVSEQDRELGSRRGHEQ